MQSWIETGLRSSRVAFADRNANWPGVRDNSPALESSVGKPSLQRYFMVQQAVRRELVCNYSDVSYAGKLFCDS